jgi:hypothetical protein
MAQQTTEVTVWVLVDSCGDYAVAKEADGLNDAYEQDIGSISDAEGLRRVKVTLTVPLPVVVELTGTVPADGPAALAVA